MLLFAMLLLIPWVPRERVTVGALGGPGGVGGVGVP